MNSPIPYQYEGHNFNLLEKDGEMWFSAVDVARELGYLEAKDLTRSLDDDEKGRHTMPTLGGNQEISIISEAGLYRAIVQRRANKKHDPRLTARITKFQRWVFHDVLPSIRRTGAYRATMQTVDYSDPSVILGCFKALEAKVAEKDEIIEEMRPKVEALDVIAESYGSFTRTVAAKNLQIQPMVLIRWLRTHGWTYRRPGDTDDIAYQSKIAAGLLEHKVTNGIREDGTQWTQTQVRVTPKGLTVLAKAFPPVARRA